MFAAELKNQGVACCAILERRDDIGIGHTRKLVALLREMSDVISEGFARLLLGSCR
jgi:hypothetical protein